MRPKNRLQTKTKTKNDTEQFLAALAGGFTEDFPDDIGDSDLGELEDWLS